MIRNKSSEIEERLEALKKRMDEKLESNEIQLNIPSSISTKYVIFLSMGNPEVRAKVVNASGNNCEKAWQKVKKSALKLIQRSYFDAQWIKLDMVTNVEEWDFQDFEKYIKNVKRNYFRKGIAFDDEFRLALLEQEINGFSLIRNKQGQPQELDEININHYMKYRYNQKFPFYKNYYHNKRIYLFETMAFFDEYSEIYELYNGELTNGIRKVHNLESEIHNLIEKSANFLATEIEEDGKFEYGYFPCFAKRIPTYNILRHSSTLYAMAEAFEYLGDVEIREAIERAIDYLINNAIVYKEDCAYVVDHANDNEVKLGANAHAILTLTKLMQVTNDYKYLELARSLGRGIISMQKEDGGFLHVLEYPSFKVKDAFRIVYYDGEAVFALLRLYDLDRQENWLNKIKDAFDFLIANEYWKYHDHWLSYAANEITMYIPEDQYFIFGLKNCHGRLNFIYHRNTTYPTFLELTMASFKMVRKIEELGKEYLFEYIDKDFLFQTIDKRAEYQRVGFCYPELVMYFKEPGLILNGFFIRHQAFRVRIDDIEHNLSGYIHYLTYRLPELKESKDLTLTDV